MPLLIFWQTEESRVEDCVDGFVELNDSTHSSGICGGFSQRLRALAQFRVKLFAYALVTYSALIDLQNVSKLNFLFLYYIN